MVNIQACLYCKDCYTKASMKEYEQEVRAYRIVTIHLNALHYALRHFYIR